MPSKDYEKISNDDNDDADSSHPALSANFLSVLSFWWMNNIFKIGSQRPLKLSDLPPLCEEDRTRDLTERLQKEWNNHVQECNTIQGKQPKLWKCLLRMFSCMEILFLMSFYFVESVCRVSQPLVLGFLLQSLSSAQRNHTLEYVCCFLLSFSGLSTALTHYSAYRLELIGMRLSSAIKGIIYLKVSMRSIEGNTSLCRDIIILSCLTAHKKVSAIFRRLTQTSKRDLNKFDYIPTMNSSLTSSLALFCRFP